MVNNNEKLTLMQRLFINAFTAFGQPTEENALLSAKAAGCKGKSDSVVSATASRWLSKVKIKGVIDGVKAARQAQLAQKTGFTIEQAQLEYEEARQHAIKLKKPAAETSAIVGKCRLYGFDKDNAIGEKTVIFVSPKQGPQDGGTGPKQVENEVIDG